MTNFQKKYYKYKSKYINLKKSLNGGGYICNPDPKGVLICKEVEGPGDYETRDECVHGCLDARAPTAPPKAPPTAPQFQLDFPFKAPPTAPQFQHDLDSPFKAPPPKAPSKALPTAPPKAPPTYHATAASAAAAVPETIIQNRFFSLPLGFDLRTATFKNFDDIIQDLENKYRMLDLEETFVEELKKKNLGGEMRGINVDDYTPDNIIESIINKVVEMILILYKKIIETIGRLEKLEPSRKLVIVVPGDSGYRQMKVIELLLEKAGQSVEIIYFPLSGVSSIITEEENMKFEKYIINKLKLDEPKRHLSLFFIFDVQDTGITVSKIHDVIKKKFPANKTERPFVWYEFGYIPWTNFLINAPKKKRCMEYYNMIKQDHPRPLRDLSFCVLAIFILYYNTRNKIMPQE